MSTASSPPCGTPRRWRTWWPRSRRRLRRWSNAGYGCTAAVGEGGPEAVDRLFATDLLGPAALVQAVLPAVRERGSGTIVTVSSIGARTTLAGGGR